MKKLFAIVLAVALLGGVSVWPASAAEATAVVYIDAPAQVQSGETVAVSLYVQGDAVGGVQGTFVYDTNELTYVSVTLRDDVKLLGNEEDVTVAIDQGVGQVSFVVTSNVAGGTAPADAWLTANFTMKATAAASKTSVSLQNVVVSDRTGDNELSVSASEAAATVLVDSSVLSMTMEGATIRTSATMEDQGIRFKAGRTDTVLDAAKIEEVGVVMLPTALLYEGQDLCHNTIGKGNTKPVVAGTKDAADIAKVAAGDEALNATLTKSTIKGRANVAITARSYVKFTDGSIVYYSHNDKSETAVVDGQASKSVSEVAKAIAKTVIANAAAQGVTLTVDDDLQNKEGSLTVEEVETLLTFCRENWTYSGQ